MRIWIARRPPSARRTYGFHRTEILAALANGATLVAIALFIVVEALQRFRNPPPVQGGLMLAIAAGGLVVNLAGLALLHGGRDESLNVRGAWLHVLTDSLGSVQAIAAGALIWAFGWNWVDPVASVLIALLVAWSAWALLSESLHVLMEGTPSHLDARKVHSAMVAVEGVADVHDLHIWTITSGFVSLSAHVVVEGEPDPCLLTDLADVLQERFAIGHTTLQLEPAGFEERQHACRHGARPSGP